MVDLGRCLQIGASIGNPSILDESQRNVCSGKYTGSRCFRIVWGKNVSRSRRGRLTQITPDPDVAFGPCDQYMYGRPPKRRGRTHFSAWKGNELTTCTCRGITHSTCRGTNMSDTST